MRLSKTAVRDVWEGRTTFKELQERAKGREAFEAGIYAAYHLVSDVGPRPWIATVHVHDHEPELSAKKGAALIELSLSFLSLFLHPADAVRLTTSSTRLPLTEETLAVGNKGELFGGWKFNKPGVGGPPEHARKLLADTEGLRTAAGTLLKRYADDGATGKISRLIERWVNALHWYGQALRETSDFIAIVDYGCAIDILSAAGGNLTAMTEYAAAALGHKVDDKVTGDGLNLKELIHVVYNEGRSAIAHGSAFGLLADLATERTRADSLTRALLIEVTEPLSNLVDENHRMLTLDKDETRAFAGRLKSQKIRK